MLLTKYVQASTWIQGGVAAGMTIAISVMLPDMVENRSMDVLLHFRQSALFFPHSTYGVS